MLDYGNEISLYVETLGRASLS